MTVMAVNVENQPEPTGDYRALRPEQQAAGDGLTRNSAGDRRGALTATQTQAVA